MDNTTALHYSENMGGVRSEQCNEITVDIWNWCSARKVWLSAVFIKGVDNVEADYFSRNFDERTEWALSREILKQIAVLWCRPSIDLFTTRLNRQMYRSVLWKSHQEATFVNTFALH